jgi:hypothetical protein
MPQRIEDTLLVVESFKSDGVEYLAGDRVPTRHRAIRRIAAERPELFAMEWSTEPVDLQWLASIEAVAEGRYEAVKRLREAEKGQRERALREEIEGAGTGPARTGAALSPAAGGAEEARAASTRGTRAGGARTGDRIHE